MRLLPVVLLTSRLFCLGLAWTLTPRPQHGRALQLKLDLASTSTENFVAMTPLTSIIARQDALLDGPEYQTLLASLGRPLSKNDAGLWTVVVGETSDNTRVVGVLTSSSSNSIYTDTLARLPTKGTPTTHAISTFLHALTHIHACLPSQEVSLHKKQNWHVLIVGGGDLAQTASRALQEGFDHKTTIVTTRKDLSNAIQPAVGELELGFAQVIGNFDVLLDTVGDEFCDQKSSVIRLLQERHGCGRYISTRTRGQEIVSDEGIIFGPNKANEYMRRMLERTDIPHFVPPKGLGATVETLLEKGICFQYPDGNPKQRYIRGWDLKVYWEATTWPRDSAGGANIRFGFPVPDDLDGIEERFMINEPPARQAPVLVQDSDATEEAEREARSFLVDVVGVSGLQSQIIDPELDCVLFLSAPYCRTCRFINPQYLRMARMGQGSGVLFAKANATGNVGKELGRTLDVDSVPTFLLFRKGRRFGKPLSISRLPSKKLQLAMDMLRDGSPWDEAKIRDCDRKGET